MNHLFNVYGPMVPDSRWSDQYDNSVNDLGEVVKDLGEVVKLRNERIDHAKESLLQIYWFLLFTGGFVTVLYLSLASMERSSMHALAVGLMALMIGLVIFLLLEVNHPFRGEIAVSKDNFENALISIAHVNDPE